MKTLLIVEDEKMIRRGIATMVKRCSVKVEEIIECRNGVEAMQILRQKQIDAMFTDIRMSKMDGVELVEKLDELEQRPLVVVISGYEDFNYSVSMLRHGVKDYILKPVKRGEVEKILMRLEEELQKQEKTQACQSQNFRNQLKYFLGTDQIPEEEWEGAKSQFDRIFCGEDWRLGIGSGTFDGIKNSRLELGMLGTFRVFIMTNEEALIWKTSCEEKAAIGFSEVHRDFRKCRLAWQEAIEARSYAFVKEVVFIFYEEIPKGLKRVEIPELFSDQFIQQFPTDKAEAALSRFSEYFFQAKHQDTKVDELLKMAAKIQTEMLNLYQEKYLKGEGRNHCIGRWRAIMWRYRQSGCEKRGRICRNSLEEIRLKPKFVRHKSIFRIILIRI